MMIRLIFVFLFFYTLAEAKLLDYDIKPSWLKTSKFMKINILDSKELKFDDKNGIKVSELSALAYNEGKLYVLSDKGYLYHFNLSIKNNKIYKLKLKKAYRLKDKDGKKLKKSQRDSEGMVFVDNNLLISFEKEPRVELFSLKAREIKKEKIHKDLKNIDDYKNENKALEGVAYNKKYGIVTAPEVPLKKENKRFHIIYAKDNTWKFPSGGSITALEFISNDEILVLERKFNKKSKTRVATLTQVSLDTCSAGVCKSKILAKIESKKGWKIDNFEGLTKIEQNKFLMISDSQESSAQKTLLIFFEVLED